MNFIELKKILVCSTFISIITSFSFADGVAQGVIAALKGNASITHTGSQATPAKVGDKIYEGDTIETLANSFVKVVTIDDHYLSVTENSKLVIEKYQTTGTKTNSLINLFYGSIRSTLNHSLDAESNYEVKTETATAGVRGTDFVVSHDANSEASTQIVTYDGVVEAQKKNPQTRIVEKVRIQPGESVTTNKNAIKLSAPVKLSASEFKAHQQKLGGSRAEISKEFAKHKEAVQPHLKEIRKNLPSQQQQHQGAQHVPQHAPQQPPLPHQNHQPNHQPNQNHPPAQQPPHPHEHKPPNEKDKDAPKEDPKHPPKQEPQHHQQREHRPSERRSRH